MASRIVFLPKFQDPWYEEKVVTFEWVPGMAKSQARKSINNLHEAAQAQLDLLKPLEISTTRTGTGHSNTRRRITTPEGGVEYLRGSIDTPTWNLI